MVANNKPNNPNDALASMAAQIRKLEEENAALKVQKSHEGRLTFKVSQKGAVSVYGLGRFPVTLYTEGKTEGSKGQWDRLAEAMPDILKFIQVNQGAIKKARALAASMPAVAKDSDL